MLHFMTTAATVPSGALFPAPDVWYKADSDATDSSGNGYDLTATNITYDTTDPKIGTGAFIINGSSAYLQRSTSISAFNSISIAARFKGTDTSGHGGIIQFGNAAAGSDYLRIDIGGDGTRWLVYDGSNLSNATTGTSIYDGNWHNVIVTWDKDGDGKARIYIDNGSATVASSAVTAALSTNSKVQVGAYNVNSDTTVPTWKTVAHTSDQIRVWQNYILTADERTAIFNET